MRDRRRIMLESLERITDLPQLPEVVYRLEEVANNPDSSIHDVASVIETDPPMAVRVLKLANSAFYRRGNHPMTTIRQATVRLGLKEIRKLALAIGATRLFVKPSPRIDHHLFWQHSLTVASVTRTVAKLTDGVRIDPDQAYVAGLLHEVGALVLDQFFEKLYDAVFRAARHSDQPIHDVEREYLGIDHAEIGAWLLNRWQAPQSLVVAVQCHHDPGDTPEQHRALCQLVHVADYVCTGNGCCGPGEEAPFVVNAIACEDLGLKVSSLTELVEEVSAESERTKTLINLAA